MNRYYVELAAAENGSAIPLAIEAKTLADGKDKASKKFGQQFNARYAEILSPETSELFIKVEEWSADEQPISPEIFRTTIAKLLKEGAAIADRQWKTREYSLVSPKAEYPNTPTDDMAVLMGCSPDEIQGTLFYMFNRNEAQMFMAIIIREGIARRLRDLVKQN
jgi:hypothetical protein